MTTYVEQLENARKLAHFKLEEAARKGSVKLIAEAQFNLEKVQTALAEAQTA